MSCFCNPDGNFVCTNCLLMTTESRAENGVETMPSHTTEQRIPVMPYDSDPNPEIQTMITLIAVNAQLANPRSLWFYEDESPGAFAAMRAVAASGKFAIESAASSGLLLMRGATIVVTVYPTSKRP